MSGLRIRFRRAHDVCLNTRGPIRSFLERYQWTLIKANLLLSGFVTLLGLADEDAQQSFQLFSYDQIKLIVAIFLTPMILWILGYATDFANAFRDTLVEDRVDTFDLIKPFESTKRLCSLIGSNSYSADGAIEFFSHPHNDVNIADNGWRTSEIVFNTPTKKIVSNPMHDNGEQFPRSDQDFLKVSLIAPPTVVTDAYTPLNLSVGLTSWEHATKTQSYLKADSTRSDPSIISEREEIRHAMVADFLDKGVAACFPNLLCLHVVCLTADDDFIALDRTKGMHFYGGKLTISFEEQMAVKDFQNQEYSAAEEWFRRAICEELFPLRRYSSEPKNVWPLISHHIKSMRIWSGLIEESLPNFSLFGVCKLNLTSAELAHVQSELLKNPLNEFDNEGKHFVISKNQIEGLLRTGHASAKWLRYPEKDQIILKRMELHPTCLYRAATVFACLK